MRLELTRVGLLVELANHYTTRGVFQLDCVCLRKFLRLIIKSLVLIEIRFSSPKDLRESFVSFFTEYLMFNV